MPAKKKGAESKAAGEQSGDEDGVLVPTTTTPITSTTTAPVTSSSFDSPFTSSSTPASSSSPATSFSVKNHNSSNYLPDIPPVYLIDKSQIGDLKRVINNCGLSWNIPDWINTIVYKGVQYKDLLSKGRNLDAIFVSDEFGEIENQEGEDDYLEDLGFPKSLGKFITPNLKFCNLKRKVFESENKLPAHGLSIVYKDKRQTLDHGII